MRSRRHGGRHASRATEAVFVDQSGRRRRLLTIIGAGLAVALLAGLGVLGIGLMTGGQVPLPGWPDSGVQADHGRPGATTSPDVTPAPGEPVGLASTAPSAAPATPDNPGQGYLHKNSARPTRSVGKPG